MTSAWVLIDAFKIKYFKFGFVLWPQNEILDSTRPLKLNPLLNNSVGLEIKLFGPFNYLLNFFNRERTISENFHSSNETKPIAKKFVTEGLSSWSMKNPLFLFCSELSKIVSLDTGFIRQFKRNRVFYRRKVTKMGIKSQKELYITITRIQDGWILRNGLGTKGRKAKITKKAESIRTKRPND